MSLEQILAKHKIVPVVVIDDVADAVPLARALVSGGLPIAEVTRSEERRVGKECAA